MLHTFVALVDAKPGVLSRVASVGCCALMLSLGLCSCRGATIEEKGKAVTIHVETLGEYPSTIRSFQVATATSKNNPIFSIEGTNEFQTWKFDLHSGQNQTNSIETSHGSYHVIAPAQQDTFTLAPKIEYIATVCKPHHLLCSTKTFSFTE